MILKIYTDGGAKGNPGPAAIGIAAFIDGKRIYTYREDIGVKTNNEAEYIGVISALKKIKSGEILRRDESRSKDKVEFYSDSNLMVNQLNGLYKVKKGHLAAFIFEIRALEQEIGLPISYRLIPREENRVADALVNGRS